MAGMSLIDFDQAREAFVAGKTGMYFDTPARLTAGHGSRRQPLHAEDALFPVDDKAHGGLPTGGNAGIITAKAPEKQKAAWEYIKFMTGPERRPSSQRRPAICRLTSRRSAPDFLKPFYEANPNFATVAQEVGRALPWQGYPGRQLGAHLARPA